MAPFCVELDRAIAVKLQFWDLKGTLPFGSVSPTLFHLHIARAEHRTALHGRSAEDNPFLHLHFSKQSRAK